MFMPETRTRFGRGLLARSARRKTVPRRAFREKPIELGHSDLHPGMSFGALSLEAKMATREGRIDAGTAT